MKIAEVAKKYKWNLPTKCPRCGGELVINASGFPECINENCPAKMEHQLARFFNTLGIKAAGDKFIENVVENDYNGLVDFVKKVKRQKKLGILNVFAGGINGEKVEKQMRNFFAGIGSKSITIAQMLALFDWPTLGTKQFEKIPKLTLQKFLNIDEKKLQAVNGIGDSIASEMTKFRDTCYTDIVEMETLLSIKEEQKVEKTDLPTICFTGVCPGYSRSELAKKCEGKFTVVNSVTKDLNILACADPNSGSSKLQKAAKNGTKVISYEELLKKLN